MSFKMLHPPRGSFGGQLDKSVCKFYKTIEQFNKPRTASNHQEEESVYITDRADLTQNMNVGRQLWLVHYKNGIA